MFVYGLINRLIDFFSTVIYAISLLFVSPSLKLCQTFNNTEKRMLLEVNDKIECNMFSYILKFLPKGECLSADRNSEVYVSK